MLNKALEAHPNDVITVIPPRHLLFSMAQRSLGAIIVIDKTSDYSFFDKNFAAATGHCIPSVLDIHSAAPSA
jgi:hypothetical protein